MEKIDSRDTKNPVRSDDSKIKFNCLFLQRIIRLWRHHMLHAYKSASFSLLLLLLLLALLEQFVIYGVGILPSKFYKVLGEKDRGTFTNLLLEAMGLIAAIAVVLSTKQYVSALLYLRWRRSITRAIHTLYFHDINYYIINVLHRDIDNPDQRLTQDVDRFCSQMSQILPVVIISPFTIAYYMYQAWIGSGYIGPVSVLIFFLIACIFNKFLLTPTVKYYAMQEKCEGDFRFKHMQIRTHAESMAFFKSGTIELEKSNQKLQSLLSVQYGLVLREYALNFAVNLCDYVGSILSYLAIAVPIFMGNYDDLSSVSLSALISKNAFVSIYLISCFTKLIDLSNKMPDVAGTTHRIGQLLEYLERITPCEPKAKPKPKSETKLEIDISSPINSERVLINVNTEEPITNDDNEQEVKHLLSPVASSSSSSTTSLEDLSVVYSIKNLCYSLPSGQNVVKNLNLQVLSGMNLLITGSSGCGKTALLRVLNHLWPIEQGSVQCNLKFGMKSLMFLPQKPYFTDGSLREQIIYPDLTGRPSQGQGQDGDILDLLTLTGLTDMKDRVGGLDMSTQINWYDILSPGEQQRLSFLRLFYHQPKLAILDEATSQLGLEMEAVLYKHCQTLGIGVISVGHRTSLYQFHDQKLELDGKGGWNLESLP